MGSLSFTIPLDQSGTDFGWIEWVNLTVEGEATVTLSDGAQLPVAEVDFNDVRHLFQEILATVPMRDFDPDENGDIAADEYSEAVAEAFEAKGFKVAHVSVGHLLWPTY